MSFRSVLVLLIAIGIGCADAAVPERIDRLPVGGRVFTNVVVLDRTKAEIFISHTGGVTNLKLRYLDREWQEKFGYDAARDPELRREPPAPAVIEAPAAAAGESPVEQPAEGGSSIPARSMFGRQAPDIVVEQWLREPPAASGKFVLLKFWATWSAPSRDLVQQLNRWHREYGETMAIVAISSEPAATVERFLSQIDYYSAIDTQKRTADAIELKGLPHVLLIDPDGIVRWEGFPASAEDPLTDEILRELIARRFN